MLFCLILAVAHLTKLLCSFPSISSRRIYQGNDWQAELVGMAHKAHGLAVTIGLGHAKVPADVLLRCVKDGVFRTRMYEE